jgi:hypothetical protein
LALPRVSGYASAAIAAVGDQRQVDGAPGRHHPPFDERDITPFHGVSPE